MKRDEIYLKLLQQNGQDHQITVAIEELAELTKELTKAVRGFPNKMRITEEIADVTICIEQLMLMYEISDNDIKLFTTYKLKRLERFYVGLNN